MIENGNQYTVKSLLTAVCVKRQSTYNNITDMSLQLGNKRNYAL